MNISRILFLCIVTVLFNCSSDSDNNNNNNGPLNLPEVTTLYVAGNDVIMQQDVINNGEDLVVTNLTDQLGVTFNYQFLKYNKGILSFFTRLSQNYSIAEKNLNTETIQSTNGVCGIQTGAELLSSANRSDENWLLFSKDIPNAGEIIIRINDKQSDSCDSLTLPEGNLSTSTTLVDGEVLYAVYTENGGENILARINLNTAQVTIAQSFSDFFKATINGNSLYLFFLDNTYLILDKDTLVQTGSGTFVSQLLLDFNFGFFQTQFTPDGMYLDLQIAQPSAQPSSPAVIDLQTGEYALGGPELIFNIKDNLAAEIGSTIQITAYAADPNTNVIAAAYRDQQTGDVGLAFSNFQAEILKLTPLDVSPYLVIIR